MSKNIITIAVAAILGLGIGYYGAGQIKKDSVSCCHESCCQQEMLNEDHCLLRRSMEKLCADHAMWTRQFIVSAVAGVGDAELAEQRLLKNQEDIGNAMIPFYGLEVGEHFAKLLKDQVVIVANIVKAATARNDAKVKELDKQWHAKTDEIATFLSTANPNVDKDALMSMFNKHRELTTQELTYRLKVDWKSDITNFDQLLEQARMMGKTLADDIIKQFPHHF